MCVVDGVDEDVQGAAARGEEGPPPPVVVFGAELEVAHDDGDLGACEEENDQHQKEEAEEVVELVKPHRRQHVVHLRTHVS